MAIFRVNNLYSVALLSEVYNSDRCRCHQTLINSSRASFSPGGEGDLQVNAFPFGHNPQDSSITEKENPYEEITSQGLWSNQVRILGSSAISRVPPEALV